MESLSLPRSLFLMTKNKTQKKTPKREIYISFRKESVFVVIDEIEEAAVFYFFNILKLHEPHEKLSHQIP
jgi:hypothetical protein